MCDEKEQFKLGKCWIFLGENQKNYNLVFVIGKRMNELMCKCKTQVSR